MLIIDLEDGRSCAVRPSGTEPKIKYYLFGKDTPSDQLQTSKEKVAAGLESLWLALEADAKSRMA
jgi:phosphoglucomutase